MCRANFQNLLTELGGQSMQLIQSADVPNPAGTRTPLGRFDMLTPDTSMTGHWLTEIPRPPHQIGRVSNPCSLSIQFTVATIVQHHSSNHDQSRTRLLHGSTRSKRPCPSSSCCCDSRRSSSSNNNHT